LSSAIANELIKQGKDVLYISCNALFPILEDMHFGREVTANAEYIVKKINECELLIMDDLGSEFVTQFTCAELFRIINSRLISGGKMIISTNLNRSMLANTYNERIASRITGGFSMLEFLGDDIRSIKKLEGKM
jgi:DNA replication protein DnaC